MGFEVTFAGRLTRDPEIQETTTGRRNVRFALVHNDTYVDSQGRKVEESTFMDAQAWDENFPANAAASLHKGDFVVATGTLRANNYTTQRPVDAENPEGDKVTVEVRGYRMRIRNIGPDLRFQSAPVTRNERQVAAAPADVEAVVMEMAANGEPPF